MTETIHQVLHGYENGHKQLASSLNLTLNDKELIDRISDLSGLLSSPSSFQPYLTGYPLPSNKYYALAKTWLDNMAPRSGCVYTHTLLIPLDDFKYYNQVGRLLILFKEPTNRDMLDYYFKQLNIPPVLHPQKEFTNELSEDKFEFVSKYFGKGIQPIVWMDNPEPEFIISTILNAIWPNLRKVFAFCTFSLNLRELENRPFDILFAPSKVRHNYRRLGENHFIKTACLKTEIISEPWQEELTQAIFLHEDTLTPQLKNFENMVQSLGSKPTDIYLLYRIHNLWDRADTSTSAALGVMDLLDSLEPNPQNSLFLKEHITSLAFNSAVSNNETHEVMRNLMLISDRLEQPGFSKVKDMYSAKFITKISDYTIKKPDAMLELAYLRKNNKNTRITNTFDMGVIKGLSIIADNNPDHLPPIDHFPDKIFKIISVEPDIAVGYYHAHNILKTSKKQTYELIKILNDLESSSLIKLRKKIIPIAIQYRDIDTLNSLLVNIQAKEVKETLNIIFNASDALTNDNIQAIIKRTLSSKYPSEVRSWAQNATKWSWEMAVVIASTFPNNKKGFNELLSFTSNEKHRALLISTYINNYKIDPFPNWLQKRIESKPEILLSLLNEVESYYEYSNTITIILKNCKEIPIVKEISLFEQLDKHINNSYYEYLIEAVFNDLIKTYIKGIIDDRVNNNYMKTEGSIEWIQSLSKGKIISLLEESISDSPVNYRRSWGWMNKVKDTFYKHNPQIINEYIGHLIKYDSSFWSKPLSKEWSQIITGSEKLKQIKIYPILCEQAVKFSFNHNELPLEEVIVISFPGLYIFEEEQAKRRMKNESSIFKLFDPNFWLSSTVKKDSRYELRKGMVNAFLNSKWKPEYLALSMPNQDVFRQILNILVMSDDGEKYIGKMKKGLVESKHSKAKIMIKVIEEMEL